jgi:hypothetical protein
MACECGAFKTYGAVAKSNLHSSWCADSPAFVPVKSESFRTMDWTVQGVVGYTPKHQCGFCTADATLQVQHPPNCRSGYKGIQRWCGICCHASAQNTLKSYGAVITLI